MAKADERHRKDLVAGPGEQADHVQSSRADTCRADLSVSVDPQRQSGGRARPASVRASGDGTELGEGVVDVYTHEVIALNSNDYDTFVKLRRSVYHVDVEGKESVESFRCSCRMFLKRNLCKHVYGLGSLWGLVEFPEAAKAVPIGQKRKRGRPCLAKRALQRQAE